jgi:hypothetical protein
MKMFFGPGGPTAAPADRAGGQEARVLRKIQSQPFSSSQWRAVGKDGQSVRGLIEATNKNKTNKNNKNNGNEVMKFGQGETGIEWFC